MIYSRKLFSDECMHLCVPVPGEKKRNSSFQNLRDGHVDQLGVGFRHGQGGHATAVPSERGERKRHPHSPGISSRQPRGHLGRNEDSVVVHVSLSLSLARAL